MNILYAMLHIHGRGYLGWTYTFDVLQKAFGDWYFWYLLQRVSYGGVVCSKSSSHANLRRNLCNKSQNDG